MKKGLKIFGMIIAGILVFSVFSYLFTDEETKKEMAAEEVAAEVQKEKEAEEKKKVEAEKEAKENTVEARTKKAIIKAVGKETNTDKKRIVSIVIENNVAKVTLNGDESLTVNLTKDAMLYDSKDVFAELDKIEELTGYHLTWNMPLVDVKGNVEDHQVIKIVMDKGHGVTWENFNVDNFGKVATSFFVHPAYQK